MNPAVDFYHQLQFSAIEIGNIPSDRVLSAEFIAM